MNVQPENGITISPSKRKKPPPPPSKKEREIRTEAVREGQRTLKDNDATGVMPFSQAAKKLGVSSSWLRALHKAGKIHLVDTQHGWNTGPKARINFEEARKAVEEASAWRKKPKVKEQKMKIGSYTFGKAKKIVTIPDEIRRFAETVMEEKLDAMSITITNNGKGGFDVVLTPRTPENRTFTV